jgi:hypothetical protein
MHDIFACKRAAPLIRTPALCPRPFYTTMIPWPFPPIDEVAISTPAEFRAPGSRAICYGQVRAECASPVPLAIAEKPLLSLPTWGGQRWARAAHARGVPGHTHTHTRQRHATGLFGSAFGDEPVSRASPKGTSEDGRGTAGGSPRRLGGPLRHRTRYSEQILVVQMSGSFGGAQRTLHVLAHEESLHLLKSECYTISKPRQGCEESEMHSG